MRFRLLVLAVALGFIVPTGLNAQEKDQPKKPKKSVVPEVPSDADPEGGPSPTPAPRREPTPPPRKEPPREPSREPAREPEKPADKPGENKTDATPGLLGSGETAKLPIHPLKGGKVGDWAIYIYVSKKQEKGSDRQSLLYKIEKIDDEDYTQSETKNPYSANMSPAISKFFSLKDIPEVEEYLRLPWSFEVKDVVVTDEKKKVGGREFNCKKLTFKSTTQDQNNSYQLWVSNEVKGHGVVALSVWGAGETTFQNEVEVVGFGNGDKKADWGKLPEEIDLAKDGPK